MDGAKILRETWDGNTLVPLYDNEDSVCGIVYNNTPYYFQKNLQGDVIGITDENGTVVAEYVYDADGNMLSARLGGANMALSYDASNRLVSAGGHTYTYNAEDVRIRNVCNGYDTTYTYNTNGRLSQLLLKTTNGITTKYVYGLGLIGEEKCGEFKTYHFDYRGSTVALTDECGSITDTFAYDTYGNVTERTGDSFVIFGYNGRDGVVTDKNGLIYMRARYYSPEMRRFVNADILRGEISDSTSLNRYSYVNGNPVSFVDPLGLAADRRSNHMGFNPLSITPWGEPNSYVEDYSDGYRKERWYGPDGRAIRDRHHTDHGNPKDHTNPHDQNWDWSDPKHPRLDPSSSPKDHQTEKSKESEESKEDTKEFSNKSQTDWTALMGVGMMIVSGLGIIWMVTNDLTLVGAADDLALVPAFEGFRQGAQMVFG